MICEGQECERCGYELSAGECVAYDDHGKLICGECMRAELADMDDMELFTYLGWEPFEVMSEEEYRENLLADEADLKRKDM